MEEPLKGWIHEFWELWKRASYLARSNFETGKDNPTSALRGEPEIHGN